MLAFLPAGAPPALASQHAGSLPSAADTPTVIGLGILLVLFAVIAAFLVRLTSLRAMAHIADARLALAEKRSQIATLPQPQSLNSPTMSAAEIETLLASGFPEIAPNLRAALARAIAAAIKDKAGA